MNQPGSHEFPQDVFSDILSANLAFAESFAFDGLKGPARRGIAVVTCMDSRISPLAALGLEAGDAKILRNAGARVTEDVLRTLMLATYLLNVKRILIMPHTDCRMASGTEADIHETIWDKFGVDTRSVEFRTTADQQSALATDVTRVRTYPLLPKDVVVGGAIYDVKTGRIEPVEC